jgi:hypothetical protein
LLDHLALLEGDRGHLAVNLAAHRYGVVWLHRPKTIQIDGEIGLLDLGHGHRNGLGIVRSFTRRSRCRVATESVQDDVAC